MKTKTQYTLKYGMQLKKCSGKIAINASIEKEERSQNNNLNFYLKNTNKEEQTKPKAGRSKKIIWSTATTNKIENRKTKEKINENKS